MLRGKKGMLIKETHVYKPRALIYQNKTLVNRDSSARIRGECAEGYGVFIC
jgi:hypothetical protein